MIELSKTRGEIYCDCCKRRATVRITAANFSACNPTNIVLCEDCLKDLKSKVDYFLSPETHATPEMISFLRDLALSGELSS